MPHALRRILPASLVLLGLGVAAPASAQVIAQNDSMDWSILDTNPAEQAVCPCFCEFECFGSTFTAPAEFNANYIYMLYGSLQPLDIYFDFYILQGPSALGPGTPFIDGQGLESIGIFLPLQSNGTELLEVQVAQSQVTPPTIAAGEEFSVAFCYNYGKESQTELRPGVGHGPIHDVAVDGGQSGDNWVQAGFSLNLEDPCDFDRSTLRWVDSTAGGDWAIRVTDQPINWLDPPGDDDDDAADDDDVGTDDDDATDDDDVSEGPIVLSVTPNRAFEGVDTVVAIQGTGFDETASAFIGGFAMGNVNLVSSERLDATVPRTLPADAVPYEITVTTSAGSNSLPGAFTVDTLDEGPDDNNCGCQDNFVPAQIGPWLVGLFGLLAVRRRRG